MSEKEKENLNKEEILTKEEENDIKKKMKYSKDQRLTEDQIKMLFDEDKNKED